MEVVNLFLWKQLEPEHLALAPLGSLPVLVTAPGRALVGRVRLHPRTSSSILPWSFKTSKAFCLLVAFLIILFFQELMEGLQQLSSSTSPGISFKNGDQWSERLEQVSTASQLLHGWLYL